MSRICIDSDVWLLFLKTVGLLMTDKIHDWFRCCSKQVRGKHIRLVIVFLNNSTILILQSILKLS